MNQRTSVAMFGMKKRRGRLSKHKSANSGFHQSSKLNPFDDSDDEFVDDENTLKPSNKVSPVVAAKNFSLNPFDEPDDDKRTLKPSNRISSVDAAKKFSLNPFDDSDDDDKHILKPSNRISSVVAAKKFSLNPFDDDEEEEVENRFIQSSSTLDAKSLYRDDFSDSGGVENKTVQELVYKSEETTKTVQGCLKVAQDITSDANRTLVMLNEQGEKMTRTHQKALDIDRNLTRGEKLLGRLGGIFSKTWKPKKTRSITGPVITRGDSSKRRVNQLETREKLGLNHPPKPQSRTHEPLPETADAFQKVEMEKAKQDDGLSDLSDLLGELKNMAVDMGTEIERQNNGLDHLQDDVEELNFRVKQSNQRARHLLGK